METPPDLLIARRVVTASLDQLDSTFSTSNNEMVRDLSSAGDPILRLRFFDEGHQIVEALYDPVIAASDFLNRAKDYWTPRLPQESEDLGEVVFSSAVNMLCWMLMKMHLRMWIAMGDLGDETWHDWAGRACATEEKMFRAEGVKINYKVAAARTQLLQDQQKQIRQLWKWTKGGSDREYDPLVEQKRQFALEYPSVLKHWEDINLWCRREDRPNWREHAKVKPFEDTPDALLDKLDDSGPERLSGFALEHTARRVGLRKPDIDPVTTETEKCGSGLSRSTLYRILAEGKRLLSLDQNPD